jgi:hypothetical protein
MVLVILMLFLLLIKKMDSGGLSEIINKMTTNNSYASMEGCFDAYMPKKSFIGLMEVYLPIRR